MNKSQRTFLKGLASEIDKVCIDQHGETMKYDTIKTHVIHQQDSVFANALSDAKPKIHYEQCFHEVNHFRRLKRTLYKDGVEGVIHYLKYCGFEPDRQLIINAL